jgi:hypothetical protein
MWFHL